MLISIFQIMYLVIFFIMLLMSVFVIFHIVFYSYNPFSRLVMLGIFVPVAGVLLLTNFVLFNQIPLERLLPAFSM